MLTLEHPEIAAFLQGPVAPPPVVCDWLEEHDASLADVLRLYAGTAAGGWQDGVGKGVVAEWVRRTCDREVDGIANPWGGPTLDVITFLSDSIDSQTGPPPNDEGDVHRGKRWVLRHFKDVVVPVPEPCVCRRWASRGKRYARIIRRNVCRACEDTGVVTRLVSAVSLVPPEPPSGGFVVPPQFVSALLDMQATGRPIVPPTGAF